MSNINERNNNNESLNGSHIRKKTMQLYSGLSHKLAAKAGAMA